jgi:2,4-didehydro-3-deoxy-L-rhamnonate hydrolase
MRLVRYGRPGQEKPGLIDADGALRDLSRVVKDITPAVLAPATLRKLRAVKTARLPLVKGKPRFGCPLAGIGKMVCIGLNYTDHAEEVGMALPKEPTVFIKSPSALSGPNDPTVRPRGGTKLDYEVELAAVIGREARYVEEGKALGYVAAYCVVNDVSERAFQMATTQWDKGKGFDTAGPIGPWLVTTDEIADPQVLDMWLDVNGRRMQSGNTRTMVFDVATIVSHVSHYMTLMPGDIIATGTPPGVGLGIKPEPVFLKSGDVMTLGIQGLGEQRQRVVAFAA